MRRLLCSAIAATAVAAAGVASAGIIVDFQVGSPATLNVGTQIVLDFSIDGSGNVTLDASTDSADANAIARTDLLDGPVGTASSGFGSTFSMTLSGEQGTAGQVASLRLDGLPDAGLGSTGRNPNRIESHVADGQSGFVDVAVDTSSLLPGQTFKFNQYVIGGSVNGPNANALVTSFTGVQYNSGLLAANDVIAVNNDDFLLAGGGTGTVRFEQDSAAVESGADGYGIAEFRFDIVPEPMSALVALPMALVSLVRRRV